MLFLEATPHSTRMLGFKMWCVKGSPLKERTGKAEIRSDFLGTSLGKYLDVICPDDRHLVLLLSLSITHTFSFPPFLYFDLIEV